MKKHNEEELDWEDRMYKWIDDCVLDVAIYVRVSTSRTLFRYTTWIS